MAVASGCILRTATSPPTLSSMARHLELKWCDAHFLQTVSKTQDRFDLDHAVSAPFAPLREVTRRATRPASEILHC